MCVCDIIYTLWVYMRRICNLPETTVWPLPTLHQNKLPALQCLESRPGLKIFDDNYGNIYCATCVIPVIGSEKTVSAKSCPLCKATRTSTWLEDDPWDHIVCFILLLSKPSTTWITSAKIVWNLSSMMILLLTTRNVFVIRDINQFPSIFPDVEPATKIQDSRFEWEQSIQDSTSELGQLM